MDTKKQRQHLQAYTNAARQIELAGAAIKILEGMNTRAAGKAIKTLQYGQQQQLRNLDKSAANLGAPYAA